jgi:mRNA interferase RelE/StbE
VAEAAPYDVIVHPKAERDLRRLPREVARRIAHAVLDLGADPYPRGKKVRRLVGVSPVTHRLRVGDYRALYRVDEDGHRVVVLRVIIRGDLAAGIAGLPRTPDEG